MVLEDYLGFLDISEVNKLRPCMKHTSIKLHHLREYVYNGRIVIHKIKTEIQSLGLMDKPLNEDIHNSHQYTVMGR